MRRIVCKRLNRTHTHLGRFAFGCVLFALMPELAPAAPSATQLPTGGVVASGSAAVSSVGAVMNINQATQKAIINWKTFDVGSQAQVNFNQPNSSSQTLNRVTGGSPSEIFGKINANGKVFLINPEGIIFGAGSQINAAGFVASTLDIADDDFNADRYVFQKGDSTGSITNNGTITASGTVAMWGVTVTNNGTINAGKALIGAGGKIQMPLTDSGLITIEATVDAASITNTGTIKAKDIQLNSGKTGSIKNSGRLDASNTTAKGGSVTLLAKNISLLDGAVVDASGALGGGTIRIGGDQKGANPADYFWASTVDMAPDAFINASATQNGDGGNVTLWSSDKTTVAGTITAKGGSEGGNGGFVETSSTLVSIENSALVNTLAPLGSTGMWLLDPTDYTIAASGGNETGAEVVASLATSARTITTDGSIYVNDAITSLPNSLTLEATSGSININSAVSWSANTLTLTASGDINVNAVMTTSIGFAKLVMTPGGYINCLFNPDGTFAGKVNLGAGSQFWVGDTQYTVITSLGASNSTSGIDLQGMSGDMSGHYVLGSDIDASSTSSWNSNTGWMPIGVYGSSLFAGVFNGLGHTINGLVINRSSTSYQGLFGDIGAAALITNVGVVGGTLVGYSYVGKLIGQSEGGTVRYAYTTGNASGMSYVGGLIGRDYNGNISYTHASGTMTTSWGRAGGLLGETNSSTLSYSYATGLAKAGTTYSGGLVGANGGTILYSYATGGASGTGQVGGITGYNTGSVSYSYATGNVSGGTSTCGGLVGTNTATGTIAYSFSTGTSTGKGLVGVSSGTVMQSFWDTQTSGKSISAAGTGITTANLKSYIYMSDATRWGTDNISQSGMTSSGSTPWVMYDGLTYPMIKGLLVPLTITGTNVSSSFTGDTWSGTNSISYSLPSVGALSGTLAYSGTYSGAASVGTYSITPSGYYSSQQGYDITYASGTLTITPAPITITANNRSKTYGTALSLGTTAYTITGSLYGTDSITGVTLTSAGADATATVAGGPYSIVASNATGTGLSNYTFTYASGTLTVNPAVITITANNQSKTYGTTASLGTTAFTISSGSLYNGDTVAGVTLLSSGADATATVAGGPYAIAVGAATGTGLSNYTILYASGSLTVNAAPITVTANNQSKTYGTAASLGTTAFTITSGSLYNGDTVAGVTLTSAGSDAAATVAGGPYSIVASNATGTGLGNYTFAYADGTLTVNPAAITITANNQSKIYGAAASLGTTAFTISSGSLYNGDAVAGVTLTSAGADATATVAGGPYAIVASNPTGTGLGNYAFTYENGTLTVNPAAITITANNQSKTYGAAASLGTSAYTLTGSLYGTDSITGVTLTSAGSDAAATVAGGPYAIVASNATGTGLSNYAFTYANGTLTVNPAIITITANNQSKTYGTAASLGTTAFTISSGSLYNGDAVDGVTLLSGGADATATVAGGPYVIAVGAATGTGLGNYTIMYASGLLTVNAAPITITANDQSKTAGVDLPLGTTAYTITSGRLYNSDSILGVLLASTGSSASGIEGSHAISISDATGSGLANYVVTYVNGVLTVVPAPAPAPTTGTTAVTQVLNDPIVPVAAPVLSLGSASTTSTITIEAPAAPVSSSSSQTSSSTSSGSSVSSSSGTASGSSTTTTGSPEASSGGSSATETDKENSGSAEKSDRTGKSIFCAFLNIASCRSQSR